MYCRLGADGPSCPKAILASKSYTIDIDAKGSGLDSSSNHNKSKKDCARPSDLPISLDSATPLSSKFTAFEGGGSESFSNHLPPPSKSYSASSSPVILRRLSATSVASRASQNRLSGGSFRGSRPKIISERKTTRKYMTVCPR